MLSYFLEELRGATKQKDKIEILQDYDCPFLRELLFAAKSPFTKFNVKINARKMLAENDMGTESIEDREQEIRQTLAFLQTSFSETINTIRVKQIVELLEYGAAELFLAVVNKKLQVGVGTTLINKVFPGLIPIFEVQRAKTYKKDYDYGVGMWGWSWKLDGMRVIALFENNKWGLYTRNGRTITTLDSWIPALDFVRGFTGSTFIEGEAYLHGKTFEEIQGAVMSTKNKKDVSWLQFAVFICGDAEGFRAQDASKFRVPRADAALGYPIHQSILYTTYQGDVSITELDSKTFAKNAVDLGYEGAMLRDPVCIYNFKRSNRLLKIKLFDYTTVTVKGIEVGPFPVAVHDEDGEVVGSVIEDLVLSINVLQKNGELCNCGSGFSLENRRAWFNNSTLILNKVIEVKHQGLGAKGKMRFPIFKRIREDL